jgi:hypothetical protein
MAWALLASPTCQRSGPDNIRCSAFLRNNRTVDSNRVSVGNGLCARKRNFCSRDEGAEIVQARPSLLGRSHPAGKSHKRARCPML